MAIVENLIKLTTCCSAQSSCSHHLGSPRECSLFPAFLFRCHTILCMVNNLSNSSGAGMECRCKCVFDFQASSRVNINMARRLCLCHHVRSWWSTLRHRPDKMRNSWCNLHHATNMICLEPPLELLFGHCSICRGCCLGWSHRTHHKHMNMAPWSTVQSRQPVLARDIYCRQW